MVFNRVPAPMAGERVNNLPIQLSIIVPSTRDGEALSQEEFNERVKRTKRWFDERFGGDTTVRGKGGYLADDELIEEPVAIVEASMSKKTYMDTREEFAQFVRERQRHWGQDSVLYKVEDRVYIYPEKEYIDDDENIPAGMVDIV